VIAQLYSMLPPNVCNDLFMSFVSLIYASAGTKSVDCHRCCAVCAIVGGYP